MAVSSKTKKAVKNLFPGQKGVVDEVTTLLGLSGTTANPASVAAGGTGRVSLLSHAVLVGAGTVAVTPIAAGAAGTLFAGQGTGADPAFVAMSGDVTITSLGVTAIGAAKVVTAMLNDSAVTAAKMDATATPTFSTMNVGTGGYKVSGTKVVGAQQAAVSKVTLTATTGSLPASTGAQVIANTATPTVVELLKLCVELNNKIDSLKTVLNAHGLTA